MFKNFDTRDLVLVDRVPIDDLIPLFPRRPTVRILVVADTSVSFISSFGIGKVIDLIRTNVDGYVHFEVDLARLGVQGATLMVDNTPAAKSPRYDNFRFSSQVDGRYVLDDYDEVWCFGFAPGNDGSSNDANIANSPFASTDQDLAVLTQWMNAGGGVLAMGDHHYLGAAMCSRIPRVRSMRRWTNAQSVPPIGGPDRFDTNRPQNNAQDPNFTLNPAVIPFDAQSDDRPQVIEWKKYSVPPLFLFERRYRPHPLLCGGELGVIDVLPDHPHEGWVYEDGDVDLSASYSFAGVSGDEYPTISSVQARPEVIAWANTLPDPPYNHQKGDSPAKRFAVIGVYNGDASDVGRVVVDSTWHHWMDVNLFGLESETPDTEYQKVVRYYRNCAVWLAREGQRRRMLTYATFWSSLRATAYEDFISRDSIWVLGGKAIDVIGRLTSECLVRDWIDIFIPVELIERLRRPRFPFPDPCWSCPPIELVERAVLGGLTQAILPLRDELNRLHEDPKAKLKLSAKAIEEAAERGAKRGLEEFRRSVKENLSILESLARAQADEVRERAPAETVQA